LKSSEKTILVNSEIFNIISIDRCKLRLVNVFGPVTEEILNVDSKAGSSSKPPSSYMTTLRVWKVSKII